MKRPTATTARRYCCCATAKPCAKARLKAWTDEAFCTWKRQRANRRSSAAKSACGPTTDRFPCRSGGIRNVFAVGRREQPAQVGVGGKRHVRNRRQRAVPRFVAFGRGVGGKGGWKCPHRRLRRVRRIQKAQVKEQLARKSSGCRLPHRLWAYATTTATRRTRFRPLVQRLGQPPLQPQRLRRRQLRHGGNG
ncbi:Uncharacterised protein [Neisseria gonorrhoeae]|uniref:Uncharacterized protein n=1 Tax=Neisseria gonorrhoeae TaxID=485 RepID=A0A378W1F2_NEIGO|nr:Uncharacterised protein [Neisseria gonorrhoeae]